MQSDQEIVLTSLQQYRSEVLSLPRLSASEERDLEQRVRQGDREARKQLVEVGLRYVAGIAWRYLCYVPQDDYLELVSVGNTAVVVLYPISWRFCAIKRGAIGFRRAISRLASFI